VGDVHNSISGTVHGDAQQAGGDIHSTKVGGGTDTLDALVAAGHLRAALASLDLGPAARRTAEQELGYVERELSSPEPDRTEVARRLERFTAVIKAAGGLLAAGATIAGPVGVIAGWLGPLGAALLHLMR
jgi:hypothetical protein